ncbi:MAG TPA: polysaccharide deacetylase [Candidatus Sulfotelmatobacter sp.]|nr:polysaccharide deacetylase [Candidatus Sulfotelmatobacter sp.]
MRHIVCLSFDFDAMSGFVSRGMVTPTLISRGEFGAVGALRLLGLLAKYRLPTTWFIPGVVLGTYPDICRRIADGGHEIAHHGWTHAPPASLNREQEDDGLARGNAAIKQLTGRNARGYRSPSWDLSPHTVELLLKHGFTYESSMMGDDYTPYHARSGDVIHSDKPIEFGKATKLIEMPISWTLDDHPHFEYWRTGNTVMPGLQNARGVLQNWIDDFSYLAQSLNWGVITYTCHPYVIGRGHRMIMLEKLIQALLEGGAAFLTMEQAAAEYIERLPTR